MFQGRGLHSCSPNSGTPTSTRVGKGVGDEYGRQGRCLSPEGGVSTFILNLRVWGNCLFVTEVLVVLFFSD